MEKIIAADINKGEFTIDFTGFVGRMKKPS
jgi:hypothetical protein